MHGAYGRDLSEVLAMRASRANQVPSPFIVGVLKSYNAADNTVDVNFPHVDPSFTQSTRMPLMMPWVGSGYGDQGGPQPGCQVIVASVGIDSDDYIALGFCYTNNQQPPGAPTKERWTVDDLGSSFKLTQDGKTPGDGVGGAKVVGAGYASIIAATLVELGAQNLTASNAGVVRKSDLVAACASVIAKCQAAINSLAAIVQSGGGVSPPTIAAATTTASTTVLAE